MSLNGVTATAGPNSSSHEIRISGFTSATIVGSYKAPCRRPPVTRRAPLATASLTHVTAAGEGDLPHPAVGHQQVPDLTAGTGERVEPLGWQPRLQQDLRQPERRQRRVGRGLEHDRVTAREGGPHLVADEVEREVERADRHDDTARDPDRHAELAAAVRGPIEGDRLAVHALGLLGRLHHRVHGTQGLGASLREDLPFLLRDQRAELLHARGHLLGRGVEDLPALEAGEPGHRLGPTLRRLERALDVGRVRARHGVDQAVVVRVAHLDRLGPVEPLTSHVHLHDNPPDYLQGAGTRAIATPAPRRNLTLTHAHTLPLRARTRAIATPAPRRNLTLAHSGARRHRCHAPRSRGSRTSRRASPSRFEPNTARLIAIPGKSTRWGAFCAYSAAETESMRPHDGYGSGTPSPRNDSVASTRIALPS